MPISTGWRKSARETGSIYGQQKMRNPSAASLIMSLESVFSVLGGLVLLHQVPTAREALGCAVMFAAIILVQLPSRAEA